MIITAIWWGFGLAILLTFFWIALDGSNFGEHQDQAIDWIIPHLVPTMSLTGAVAYMAPAREERAVTRQMRFAFLLTCAISVIYLLLIAAVIVHAVTGTGVESARGAVDTLTGWNKLLGIFQGLAASSIGVFFVRN